MRKNVCVSTVILLLIAGLSVAVFACGSSTGASSTTTLSTASESSTTVAGETTTTVAGSETTTSSTAGETTSTSQEETTTTEAAPTSDTADHAAEFRAQHPSTESFDNFTWSVLIVDPGGHLGAAVDVKGQTAHVTVDPDSRYLTWQLTVSEVGGRQTTALCRTNITVDRSLLSGGGTVEVKGVVVGAQEADVGGGPIIYVESVQKAA